MSELYRYYLRDSETFELWQFDSRLLGGAKIKKASTTSA